MKTVLALIVRRSACDNRTHLCRRCPLPHTRLMQPCAKVVGPLQIEPPDNELAFLPIRDIDIY
ncbi:MAG: hypothetical protein MJA83_01925 [Gammaproteobacteria bacterium]|nr:hypothetical protein [Gammaproteobacteria bacterium]